MLLSFPSAVTTLQSAESPFEERFHRALNDMRRGLPIILVDDFDRENRPSLIAAAETISVPTMAPPPFAKAAGIVCLCLPEEALAFDWNCHRWLPSNERSCQTAFTVTVDAREGITTGVSAQDRVTTIRAAVEDNAQPGDLVRPGHVFPLRAAAGGILARQGHTEGSVELARID